MYLKNLTVFGFKSFADKTSLNFLPGITAIVGPNGCGKSNVADAIRWVLGEQSAKALRGGEMADVIFNGTDGRKAIGMAEVSLTVGGVEDENLKAAGVEIGYNEVTLTRRVFRDGGSEYFINKTPCRLKDIQQLFMGTGVGRTSYSIMAQGNITQILSSKPEDRRMVFEEAAGITRFKAQKKEALRKLESTEQNLLRVADLIREVKRQIGSLQRQAGKARRYKQYMLEIQHLDTQLARHQFDVLQAEIAQRQAHAETLRCDIEERTAGVLRGENEIAQLRLRLTELERLISESQQRGLQLKAQIDSHDSRMHYNQERLRELEGQNAKAQSDILQAEERRLTASQELASVLERLAASTAKLDQHREELNSRREALLKVESDLRRQQESLQQAQSAAFSAAQQLTRVRNEITALDLQKQGNAIRLEKLSSEKIQLEEERMRLELRLAEFERDAEAEKVDVQARRLSVEERQQRLREIQQELGRSSQELDGLQRRQADRHSRLTVLEQLQSSHEGFSAGTLAALKNAQDVVGALADRIRVPDDYIVPVEAALGHHLQLVLTEQPESAHQILADLSANKRGRASVAPLSLLRVNGSPAPSNNGDEKPLFSPEPGLLQPGEVPALSVIHAEDSIQALLGRLLGQTMIVGDLAQATSAWHLSGGNRDFVTRTGELLTRHGVFTGGSSNGAAKTPSSILGRKNEIEDLRVQLTEVQALIAEASRRKGALQSEQTALQASLQQAQTELRAQEVAIATRQGEFNALRNAQRVLHQKIDTVVYEVQNLAGLQMEGEEKRAALAEQVTAIETREAEAQQRLADTNTSLESLRQLRDQAHATLTESKVALATEEQLCAAFRNQQRPLEQRLRELEQLLDQRRSEIESFLQRRDQAQKEIDDSCGKVEMLRHAREQESAQTAQLVSQRDAQGADIAGREDQLRDQRRQLTSVQEQRGAVEVELAQKVMSVQNQRERVQQKYQVNLDDVRSECITITFAADGPAKVVTLSPEEMAAAGVATDWDAVADQVASLQKRIDEIGPVNLVAIEEYEETEQRFQFLTTQHDDLAKAKEQLVEVINRVNTQTQQMFNETFIKIRDNFRTMFVEIFGGGKADLHLVNEGDVLESGIDIVARPPGKQLQSISLLSGGEQTMTAVALLFAIYQVKPSPFCVLDELDAPLDESNINRFVRILQRFLAHSQFVIITHNKRTIGMADVLYGITMQEHGVSKVVSVKFHKADEPAQLHAPAPLEPPAPVPAIEPEEDREQEREETLELSAAT